MGFVAPLLLAGLATLAIPVLIHLIQRERKRVVEFPSLMFLRKIPYQSVRRRRIRDWMLLMMRLAADGFILNSASMGAPGVDEVRWLAPLRPGRQIILRTTVLDTRASSSRPEMGFVRMLFEVIDDVGVTVMTLSTSLIMGRRGAVGA